METANEFIANFLRSLDRRNSAPNVRRGSSLTAAPRGCQEPLVSDVPPPQTRLMMVIRNELCPVGRCSDVDRAIIGASLGG